MSKDKKQEVINAILYRDGKPLTSRTRAELALIGVQHIDPKHADYNPKGETTPPGVTAAYEVIETEQSRSKGGKKRGEQKREEGRATKANVAAAEVQLFGEKKRPTNKAVARIVDRSSDHIRKLRKKRP